MLAVAGTVPLARGCRRARTVIRRSFISRRRRCLLPDPAPGSTPGLSAAEAQGTGTAVEVEGKWTALELDGPDAARLLCSSLDVGRCSSRAIAPRWSLFDCPAVLAVRPPGYIIYVKSSYAADF